MHRPVALGFLALSLCAAGCRKHEVTAYRVPKEKEPPHHAGDGHDHGADKAPVAGAPTAAPARAGGGSMASTPVPTAAGAGLTWTAPAHWTAQAANPMRKATYAVPGGSVGNAELTITAFPGDVGGEVANVNRWRGQIKLAPQSAAEVDAAITRLEQNGLKMGLVEMANPAGSPPTRVFGAFVPHGGSTWFFKLTGPDAVVAKEKAAFLDFLKTVQAGKAP
ncbi:MAG TPA: hypothetical protein VM029_07270 [Opitutaceae bacterium]|nr:hypothetical protein [Opitutaceae bacterium]